MKPHLTLEQKKAWVGLVFLRFQWRRRRKWLFADWLLNHLSQHEWAWSWTAGNREAANITGCVFHGLCPVSDKETRASVLMFIFIKSVFVMCKAKLKAGNTKRIVPQSPLTTFRFHRFFQLWPMQPDQGKIQKGTPQTNETCGRVVHVLFQIFHVFWWGFFTKEQMIHQRNDLFRHNWREMQIQKKTIM